MEAVKQKVRFIDMDIAELLFAVSIILLPYDAFRIMPSSYRPVSIIPLALAFVFLVINRNERVFGKVQGRLLVFYFLSLIVSVLITVVVSHRPSLFFDAALTMTIGVFVFVTFSVLLKRKTKSIGFSCTVDWLMRLVCFAYIIPLLVCLLQAFSLYGPLPGSINVSLTTLFGGNITSRMTGTSSEASWNSIHLMIASVAFFYMAKSRKQARYAIGFIVAVSLFLIEQSMQGYGVCVATVIVAFAVFSWFRGNLLLVLKALAVLVGLYIVVLAFVQIVSMLGDQSSYYVHRIVNFTSLDGLIRKDGSSFVRLVHPVIGFQMFLDYPIFGVGGGNFSIYYPYYISEYYPWAVKFSEVVRDINGVMIPTPLCLYSRVAAEFGFLGLFTFFGFLAEVLRGIGAIAKRKSLCCSTAVFLVLFALCTQLQFCSFAFVPFWLFLSIASSMKYADLDFDRR